VNDQNDTIYFGSQVKMLPNGKVGGYLVRFSGPSDPDLVGDFFTKETVFGPNRTPPLLYHHGFDGTLKSRIIGDTEWKIDDVGIWLEAQLSLRDEYEKHINDLVEKGMLAWSSGAVSHTVEREAVGKSYHIKTWIIGEASLTPTPAEPRNSAVSIKSIFPDRDAEKTVTAVAEQEGEPTTDTTQTIDNTMADETKATEVVNEVNVADTVQAAVKAAMDEFKASQTQSKEVKFEGGAPAIIMDSTSHKYDNYSIGNLALTAEVLKSASHLSSNNRAPSEGIYKAIARRLDGSEGDSQVMAEAKSHLKSFLRNGGVKANELHQSTLANYGDEWVGVAYSSDLWNKVRQEASILAKFPQFEFPAGVESLTIPLESTDPTWYKVAQSASLTSNPGGIVTNTVTSSQTTTANKAMTLSKLGARELWTGEMSEDSVLPFADQLYMQLALSGAEYLESAILDGDTAAGATANINDIAGTPASTDYFLAFDGPRKLALVTNTANSRDGGVITTEDYLETAKLMGTNGRNAIDKNKVGFVIDNSTHYKTLTLADVKTRDVNSAATVENGTLSRIYGYDVHVSGHMCKAGSGLSNTAGKVDVDTPGNNTKGQILAIRWDQWRFAFRRRMTIETTRVAAADATEIVAMMRAGFSYRDTEASAISYNLTV
jgi:hypothetical protein